MVDEVPGNATGLAARRPCGRTRHRWLSDAVVLFGALTGQVPDSSNGAGGFGCAASGVSALI